MSSSIDGCGPRKSSQASYEETAGTGTGCRRIWKVRELMWDLDRAEVDEAF